MSEYILNLLPLHEGEREEFESIAPGAVHVYARSSTATPEQIAAATVIFGWPRPEVLKGAASLKWFQTMWAGTEEYEGVLPQGALFTSSSGTNRLSVAEHMLSGLLSICHNLPRYRDAQTARRWEDLGAMRPVQGSTVLVVGAGNIGATFAGMCHGLGARTVGLKRTVRGPVEGFDELDTLANLDRWLPRADVVALCLPHAPETVGLLSRARIALMKDDAILISAGRGSVLDQDALVEAMQGGKLHGAFLDVTVPEPLPQDHPLWTIPNVVITPHVAGGMRMEITRRACIKLAQDNLRRYLAGETLVNVVK